MRKPWPAANGNNNDLCPIRIFLKVLEKRNASPHIASYQSFLTVQLNWEKEIWDKTHNIIKNGMSLPKFRFHLLNENKQRDKIDENILVYQIHML